MTIIKFYAKNFPLCNKLNQQSVDEFAQWASHDHMIS